jgi:LPS-assembly protein
MLLLPLSRIKLLLTALLLLIPWNLYAQGSPQDLAHRLGWVSDPCTNNLCEGYYELSAIDRFKKILQPIGQNAIDIHANQSSFSMSGASTLSGKVSLTESGRSIHADQASLSRHPTSGGVNYVDFSGNVRIQQPGQLVIAEKAHIDWPNKTGYLSNVLYRILLNEKTQRPTLQAYGESLTTCKTCQSSAWGQAAFIEQKPSGVIELKHATYSTCSPVNTTWRLVGSRITLDRKAGRGYARDVTLRVKQIPVLYFPYLSFPLDTKRKTGFLFPTAGSSQDSGPNVSVPFYWNIAPNYDDTFTPRLFTERGIQINNLFRYLTPINQGAIDVSVLPDDRAFEAFKNQMAVDFAGNPALNQLLDASNNRTFLAWKDNSQFNKHWSGNIDYNYVSDDYYFQDFGNGSVLSLTNQLLQQAGITYTNDIWTFSTQFQGYETLHPVNQSVVSNQYMRLPQIVLSNTNPQCFYGLNYQFNSELVHFQRDKNPGELLDPPEATRFNIQPQISWPWVRSAGYITPTLQLSATQYDINHQQPPTNPNKIDRVLPIFDIDAGLYFDRMIRWLGKTYHQTFEPRLFYLNVPFQNQTDIPVFDTTVPVFNTDQLFRTNRFAGIDRIGDANQITLAATTRFLCSGNGEEKANATIGEIFYFQNRRVTLCDGLNCEDVGIGAVPPKDPTSPLVGQVNYFFDPHWNTSVSFAWNPNGNQAENTTLNLQYIPAANHVFNLGYNFIRNGDILDFDSSGKVTVDSIRNLNQTAFSFAWPINDHWHMLGNWNYNLSRGFSQTYFYGLEYNGCCFAIRAIGGRTYTALNQNTNPVFGNVFYLQLQLKGLGNFGSSDPGTLLKTNIPGYRDIFS